MRRTCVSDALHSQAAMDHILVKGWVRTRRDSKGLSFLEINDGSCLKNLQVVVDNTMPDYANLTTVTTGAAVEVQGALIPSPGKGQLWEVKATHVTLLGAADPHTYPLQKKGHSDEFLREIGHLRPRFNKGDATAFTDDFFGKKAYLTVSGQLEAELLACALGKVYTFGPTFRAENSNTPRHAAEFWMIEPEVAFADLADNMDLSEKFVRTLVTHVMDHCAADLELFARFVDPDLMRNLEVIAKATYVRLPYTEAIELLQHSGKKFEFPIAYGADLQTEHERYLTEEHIKKPVIVYNYPKEIKPFYMRLNDDDR